MGRKDAEEYIATSKLECATTESLACGDEEMELFLKWKTVDTGHVFNF